MESSDKRATGRSRRSVLKAGLGVGAIWSLGASLASAAPATSEMSASRRTWLLRSADELRPAAPGSPTAAEFDELLALQEARDAARAEIVARWGAGPAVLPWTAITLDLVVAHKPNPPRAARAYALVHAAMADAVVATLDARAAWRRGAPAELVLGLTSMPEAGPAGDPFPSEHAAIAGAASTVLAALFPNEPTGRLARLADEAALSRLWAGAAFRSDVEAGLRIGRAIGERAVARAASDGADAVWDGTGRPLEEGAWMPTPPGYVEPPLEPLAGRWKPWVVTNGEAFRPAPPPPWGSPGWEAELAAVQEAVARRTIEQEAAAHFWAGGPGTVTPAGIWLEIAHDQVARDELALPEAARVLALTSIAAADAFICCWDTKFAYWTARPITADPSLDLVFPTPPFPSYTSGHATVSTAAATILGHLFPADEEALRAKAIEAKNSRLWAGIHFPIDNDLGAAMGDLIGRLVAEVARRDGAA